MQRIRPLAFLLGIAIALTHVLNTCTAPVLAQSSTAKQPEFPPHTSVLAGYEKVISDVDKPGFYTLWVRKKDGQMLAELPKNYATAKQFIALTLSSGDRFAGLQSGEMYVYWRRYDKQLALISPNIDIRSTGDAESKSSVKRLFTDRVITSVPIITMGPSGTPVIDLDALLVGNASLFYGSSIRSTSRSMASLVSIKKAKSFPDNIEVAFEIPTSRGDLKTIHYSISTIPDNTGYKPRKADERIGYFTTSYSDLGKYDDEDTRIRYINRWKLEKADPSLKLSPPKEPIVFYIEHTTPVRYRRWVRQGILSWNKAFEKIGISDAIEVRYQDARSGAHMEKDPEDVRYNFVRWLNNDVGTAIGPSRVHPLTGQILDADIILTDGWIRHYRHQFEDIMPKIAMQGFAPRTLAWLANNPEWDPRIRLSAPARRREIAAEIARQAAQPFAGHPLANVDSKLIGDDQYDGLVGRTSQINGMCLASEGKAFDAALIRMHFALLDDAPAKEEDKEKKDEDKPKKDVPMIDGMPEAFVGPLLSNLVAHEVGHTLGLRHNFKGSGIYTLAEINSDKIKGKKPLAGSVMDYTPVNIRHQAGEKQGDYTMIDIGPYDMWAIEYGYTFDKDLKPILNRVAEPELQFATDEDTMGPDPFARRYDFSKNPLDYARDRVSLARAHREKILEQFVKDGESWATARRGYELTLSMQIRSTSMMANWLGGTFVRRDKKGDAQGRKPLEAVSAAQQREALKFVIDNSFTDEAFGLTPELLAHLTVDKWLDGGFHGGAFEDSTWPIHDRILGIQASALTTLLRPTTLERIYDNEFRANGDDAFTIAELMQTIDTTIWSDLDNLPKDKATAAKPFLSSLRRNLQREHINRLIDLYLPGNGSSAAELQAVANLAGSQLRDRAEKIDRFLKDAGDKLDPYSRAHLSETRAQIEKALESRYIYNANSIGGRSTLPFMFFNEEEK